MQVEVVPTHNLANVVSVSLEGKVTRKKNPFIFMLRNMKKTTMMMI